MIQDTCTSSARPCIDLRESCRAAHRSWESCTCSAGSVLLHTCHTLLPVRALCEKTREVSFVSGYAVIAIVGLEIRYLRQRVCCVGRHLSVRGVWSRHELIRVRHCVRDMSCIISRIVVGWAGRNSTILPLHLGGGPTNHVLSWKAL